jgi:hypothetical protein
MSNSITSEKRLPRSGKALSVLNQNNVKSQQLLSTDPGPIGRDCFAFCKPLIGFGNITNMRDEDLSEINCHTEPPSVLRCGKPRISEGAFGTNRGIEQ